MLVVTNGIVVNNIMYVDLCIEKLYEYTYSQANPSGGESPNGSAEGYSDDDMEQINSEAAKFYKEELIPQLNVEMKEKLGEGKPLPARYARHLYDVYNMGKAYLTVLMCVSQV